MTTFARTVLASERERRPEVVELARALSIASQIEPELVRAMRLALWPHSDPGLELDLWWSPLVQGRDPLGVRLHADVVAGLHGDLASAEYQPTLGRAWRVVAQVHGIPCDEVPGAPEGVPPSIAFEEELTYVGLLAGSGVVERMERLLGRALTTLHASGDAATARWAARLLPRMPAPVRGSVPALALARLASAQLGGVRIRGVLDAEHTRALSPDEFRQMPTVTLGVRFVGGGLEISTAAEGGRLGVQAPRTDPVVLDVLTPDSAGWPVSRVTLGDGLAVVAVPRGPLVRLRTLAGDEVRLRPAGVAAAPVLWAPRLAFPALSEGRERPSWLPSFVERTVNDLGWTLDESDEPDEARLAAILLALAPGDDPERVVQMRPALAKAVDHSGSAMVAIGERVVSAPAGDGPAADEADRALKEWTFHGWSSAEEALEAHAGLERDAARARIVSMLRQARERTSGAGNAAGESTLRARLIEIEIERGRPRPVASERREEEPPAPLGLFHSRDDVLAELDRLTRPDADGASGFVLVTGAAGVGKSAAARALADRRHANGLVAYHHDLAGTNWPDLDRVFLSLVADLNGLLGLSLGPAPGAIPSLVARVLGEGARRGAISRERPLYILLDGLDGPDKDDDSLGPLYRYFSQPLPAGAFVVTTARGAGTAGSGTRAERLVHDGRVVRTMDLDDPRWRSSADAAIRRFWTSSPVARQPARQFGERNLQRALAFCDGNYRVATMLERWFEVQPGVGHVPNSAGAGLADLVELVLEANEHHQLHIREVGLQWLELLSVAREPIPLARLAPPPAEAPAAAGRVLETLAPLLARRATGFDDPDARDALVDRTSIARLLPHRVPAVKPNVPRARSGEDPARHERLLAAIDGFLQRSTDSSPSVQWAAGYKMRHELRHALDGQLVERVRDCLSRPADLSSLLSVAGYDAAFAQAAQAEQLAAGKLDGAAQAVVRAVRGNGHWLRRDPQALPSLVWNDLVRTGWTPGRVASELSIDAERDRLRLASTCGTGASTTPLRPGHNAGVTAVAVSAGGSVVVSGGRDWTVRAWTQPERSMHAWRAAGQVQLPSPLVTALSVSTKGLVGAAGDASGGLHVWTLNGAEVLDIAAHEGAIAVCALSLDDNRVLSGGTDGRLKIWNVADLRRTPARGKRPPPIPKPALDVQIGGVPIASAFVKDRAVVLASDGRVHEVTRSGVRRVRSVGRDAVGGFVDPDTGTVLAGAPDGSLLRLPLAAETPEPVRNAGAGGAPAAPLEAAYFAERMPLAAAAGIVVAARSEALEFIDGQEMQSRTAHREPIQAVASATVGSLVATASADNTVVIWRADERSPVAVLGEYGQPAASIAATADGRVAAFIAAPDALAIRDLITNSDLGPARRYRTRPTACRFVDDDRLLVVGFDNGEVAFAGGTFSRFESSREAHRSAVRHIEWMRNPRRVVTTADDGSVAMWSPGEWSKPVNRFVEQRGPLRLAGLDEARVATFGPDGDLMIWSADRALWRTRTPARAPVRAVAGMAPTGIVADASGAVYVLPGWPEARPAGQGTRLDRSSVASPGRDLSGVPGFRLPGAASAACVVSGSRGSQTIVFGTDGGDVVLVDPARNYEITATLQGHTRPVNGVAPWGDGRRVVSWSVDGSIRIWDVVSHEQVSVAYGLAPFDCAQVIRPRGQLLAADALGQVWLFDVDQPSSGLRPRGSGRGRGSRQRRGPANA